jgi:O-antigen ligase
MPFLLAILIVLAPHTKFFISISPYLIRPFDVFSILTIPAIILSRFKDMRLDSLSFVFIIFLIFQMLSIFVGIENADNQHVNMMFNKENYALLGLKKILLTLNCFLVFNFISTYKAKFSVYDALKYLYFSLSISASLHLAAFFFSNDIYVQRGGVFLEGNHAGVFYIVCFFLMKYASDLKYYYGKYGLIFSFIGLLLTISTASYLIFFLLIAVYCIKFICKNNMLYIKNIKLILAVILIYAILAILFGSQIYDKLFSTEMNPDTFSRYERLSAISAAFEIFLDYPTLGSGIESFNIHLHSHANEIMQKVLSNSDSIKIVNNIYLQILSELGIVGFIIFLYINYLIYKKLSEDILIIKLAWLSIIMSWFAFPSYTVSFQWLLLGLLVKVSNEKNFIHKW